MTLEPNNYWGSPTDEGQNLSSDASVALNAAGSMTNTDPKLGLLGNFGGPTPTIPLLGGSPAIDAGNPAWCPPTDQRGRARPYGAACDIGAFESSPPYTIRGAIAPAGLAFLPQGMTMTIDGTTTNLGAGNSFRFDGLTSGTHLLAPAASNLVFVPHLQNVTVGPDVVNASFTAYRTNAFAVSCASNVTHIVYAGAAGQSVRVFSSVNGGPWLLYSTQIIQPDGTVGLWQTNTPSNAVHLFKAVSP